MPYEAVREKFDNVITTMAMKLFNEGGTWHKARTTGFVHASPADTGRAAQLTGTQFIISARSRADFHLLVVPEGTDSVKETLRMFVYRYTGDLRPLMETDFWSSPPNVAAASNLAAFAGLGKVLACVTHDPADGAYLVLCIDVPGRLLLGRRLNVVVCAESEFDLHTAASVPTISVSPPVTKVSNILQAASGPLPPVPGSSAPNPVASKTPLPPASSKTPLPPAPKTPLPPVAPKTPLPPPPAPSVPVVASPPNAGVAQSSYVASSPAVTSSGPRPESSANPIFASRHRDSQTMSDGNGGLIVSKSMFAVQPVRARKGKSTRTPLSSAAPELPEPA